MNARTIVAAAVAAAMMAMTVSLFAAEQAPAPKSEPIYGYRMMNDQERNEYREKMRNAKSAEERQALRDENHKRMQARAKERGVTLPEQRGPRGEGKGPGYGPGSGKGPGYGKGPGGEGKGPGYGPGGGKGQGYGKGPGGEGKGPGYGKGPGGEGKGPGYGPDGGKGPGYGKGQGYGPRGDCPAGQDCPGPGAGKGAGTRP